MEAGKRDHVCPAELISSSRLLLESRRNGTGRMARPTVTFGKLTLEEEHMMDTGGFHYFDPRTI